MSSLRHFARISLGIGLVILGIVGLILPVMPGWIFLIPGLVILADYFPPIRRLVNFLKERFEHARAAYTSAGRGRMASENSPTLDADGRDNLNEGVSAANSERIP